MQKLTRLFRTLYHLRLRQIVYQVAYRLYRPKYKRCKAPRATSGILKNWIPKNLCCFGKKMVFLNISDEFRGWNRTDHGMLWAYNLNYMDWLCQPAMPFQEGAWWIDDFIENIPSNKVGLDTYPTALRTINWIKFIVRHQNRIDPERLERWNDSLWSQCRLMRNKLEYHLLGNHLLEDACSLFFTSVYFKDKRMFETSSDLLIKQLKEQILPDGAHYEQSPMYHCILLDRLLDCYNISSSNDGFAEQQTVNAVLRTFATKMLGHLESILYSDGTFPLFNDSAFEIAPKPADIMSYAHEVNLDWTELPMRECGYRKLSSALFESFVDVGNIIASYQPGHSHSDTFNYELRIGGKPFIVDTGISTYDKTRRRQYERSTAAHNTVLVNDKDSNEVWGGFRVGKRANVKVHRDTTDNIAATHDGFGKSCTHTRSFSIRNRKYVVSDSLSSDVDAVNCLHFAPEVEIISSDDRMVVTNYATILMDGVDTVEVGEACISTTYNTFKPVKTLQIHFSGKAGYSITGSNQECGCPQSSDCGIE